MIRLTVVCVCVCVCMCVLLPNSRKDACESALAGSYESIALICQLSALIQLITFVCVCVYAHVAVLLLFPDYSCSGQHSPEDVFVASD